MRHFQSDSRSLLPTTRQSLARAIRQTGSVISWIIQTLREKTLRSLERSYWSAPLTSKITQKAQTQARAS